MADLLPPEVLPPLPDPAFGNRPGPYAYSELRRVVGTRINPDSIGWYKRRDLLRSPVAAKTCAHPELEGWLGDVRSYDPQARVTQPSLSKWPFTGVVPRVSVSANLRFPLAPATYMIDYAELNSNPTVVAVRPWVENLKAQFPEGSDLLLSFFGNRNLVLGLWTQLDFWYAPFLDNFTGIILPDFSAF